VKLTHGNISVYVPRKNMNFLKICIAYAEEELGITSFSNFIILCIKDFVNRMNKDQKAKFEAIAQRIAKEEKPRATEYVDKFMKTNKRSKRGS